MLVKEEVEARVGDKVSDKHEDHKPPVFDLRIRELVSFGKLS
jgi:hypothetical protein